MPAGPAPYRSGFGGSSERGDGVEKSPTAVEGNEDKVAPEARPFRRTDARRIVTESKEPGAYQLIGSISATQSDLSPETYRFGVGVLDEATRLWPNQFLYAAMKADVVFRLGDRGEVLRLAKGALAAAEGLPQPPANVVALIRKNIDRYEKAH